jgi:transcriptional regulator with XRE-family HTH domain
VLFLFLFMPFAENLRSELDYRGLIVKQLSAKTGVNIHTLNHYLSGKKSMPPADVAVKIAAALGVSVEYLVTGKVSNASIDMSNYLQFRTVLDKLRIIPEEVRAPIIAMIETAAEREREKKEKALG